MWRLNVLLCCRREEGDGREGKGGGEMGFDKVRLAFLFGHAYPSCIEASLLLESIWMLVLLLIVSMRYLVCHMSRCCQATSFDHEDIPCFHDVESALPKNGYQCL